MMQRTITGLSQTNFTYAGNLMKAASGGEAFSLDYDLNGNMKNLPVSEANQLVYNWDGKLRSAQKGSNTMTVRYDPAGNRIYKNSSITGQRKYIVDIVGDLPVILMELNTSGNILKTYIYGNSQILAQHDGSYTANRFFYLHDRLGSVRQIINTSANVVNYYTYNPFGEILESGESITNPWRFTGQYYDSETDLYYLRARQYHPHIYRFTTRDPFAGNFQEPLSLHKYLYCQNEPVNYIDPMGLWRASIHNELLQAEFLGTVPEIFMNALYAGSSEVDTWKYQDPAHAYMHAMRAGAVKREERDQTPEEAQRLMFGFMVQKYGEYRSLLSAGRNADAYFALGMAMHPIMDFTDPLHEGFQKWSGGYVEGYRHWKAEPESIDPSTERWTIYLMNQTLANLEIAYELSLLWELSR
jgi:RHS repeat-associated protein